mmetsp:Transcript_31452/g.86499  ORF Transcript_31452/g.86499 Transcript_31452/m.86499 type:complete len:253 (+) Transcript_31452:90-848(+)
MAAEPSDGMAEPGNGAAPFDCVTIALHEQDDIVFVPEQVEAPDSDDSSGIAGRWQVVRSCLAAVVQQPIHYIIGDDTESIVESLREPVTIMLPKWALWSMLGLGASLLLQQQRQIWQHEREKAAIVNLMHSILDNAHRTSSMTQCTQTALNEIRTQNQYLGLGVATAGAWLFLLLSDRRLKKELLRKPGTLGGCPLYTWKWSDEAAARFGLEGASFGVLAQDVARLRPEAVQIGSDGYLRVSYQRLLETSPA